MTPLELIGRDYAQMNWAEMGLSPPTVEEIEGTIYIEFPNEGFDAVADLAGKITTVHLHAQGHEGYSGYHGVLPNGIRFGASRDELRARLGPPDASGEASFIHPFGPTPPWDRWNKGPYTVHCQFPDGA